MKWQMADWFFVVVFLAFVAMHFVGPRHGRGSWQARKGWATAAYRRRDLRTAWTEAEHVNRHQRHEGGALRANALSLATRSTARQP